MQQGVPYWFLEYTRAILKTIAGVHPTRNHFWMDIQRQQEGYLKIQFYIERHL